MKGAHTGDALQASVQAPICQVPLSYRDLQRRPPCHHHNGAHDIHLGGQSTISRLTMHSHALAAGCNNKLTAKPFSNQQQPYRAQFCLLSGLQLQGLPRSSRVPPTQALLPVQSEMRPWFVGRWASLQPPCRPNIKAMIKRGSKPPPAPAALSEAPIAHITGKHCSHTIVVLTNTK